MELRSLLAAVEEAAPLNAVEVLAGALADEVGAHRVGLLIADLSGDAVIRLSHVAGSAATAGRNERGEVLLLEGTVYEQVLRTQEVTVVAEGDGWMVLVPVTERGDTIGVLEVSLADRPGPDGLELLIGAGHALAYVLIAVRRHTDLFEWGQRNTPFSVSAEIQRRLLPAAYTAETGPVTVAGWLEPSHTAGGDTFDYSVDREYLYCSLTDAVGHSTEAALLATLTVAAFRNRRRGLGGPSQQADTAEAELGAHARPDQFVTGLVARLHLTDGTVDIVNAGHPPPYLIRDGQAKTVDLSINPPLGSGLVGPNGYQTDTLRLQPGDRLVMVTDGYLERRAEMLAIEPILAAGGDHHPRQVVRDLARSVLQATGGRLLDDATALCVDYHGPGRRRHAIGGADPSLSPDT